MTYGLTFKTEDEAKNFYNVLCSSFRYNEDFYIYDNSVSIYYRLNWGGVTRERNLFISPFILKNHNPVINKDSSKDYLFLENGSVNTYNGEANKEIYDLGDVDSDLNVQYPFPINPVDLLSVNCWQGSNGESFLIKKDNLDTIVYKKEDDYDEETEETIEKELSPENILVEIKTNEFNDNLGKSLSFIKEIVNNNNNSDEYISLKSREVMFMLKQFMYSDTELFVYMG